jgi:carbon monoxide dehydrogenase subunit G
MRVRGSAEFGASRERVWSLLIDPARLGPCSPVPIERVDDTHYRAQARIGSGFFSATIKGEVEVTDVVPGVSARIVGRGGASGTTLEGTVTFELRPGAAADSTIVDWEVEVRVTGFFAGQAERIIDEQGPAKMEELLRCIHSQLEDQAA